MDDARSPLRLRTAAARAAASVRVPSAAALLLALTVCPLSMVLRTSSACGQEPENGIHLLPASGSEVLPGDAPEAAKGSRADSDAPRDSFQPDPAPSRSVSLLDEFIPPPAATGTDVEQIPLPDDAEDDETTGDDPPLAGDGGCPIFPDGCEVRPQDELWYVSSRHLGCGRPRCRCPDGSFPDFCCPDTNAPCLQVWRYDRLAGRNVPSSLGEFFAHDDPGVITCFYVHGARVTEYRAFARLPLIYRALVCGLPPEVRVRMVLFSWPNPKSARVVKDFRIASAEAPPHGHYLAWLVSRIDPRVKVSLLSFSLGAQLVTGALNAMACGDCVDTLPASIEGRLHETDTLVTASTATSTGRIATPAATAGKAVSVAEVVRHRDSPVSCDRSLTTSATSLRPADRLLQQSPPADATSLDALHEEVISSGGRSTQQLAAGAKRRVRVVMWTAAVDDEWILPGHRHGCALESVDRMLLVTNHCDPVLKRFTWINPCGSPRALGYTGVVDAPLLGGAAKIKQCEAGCWLGRSHAYRKHIDSPCVIQITQPYLFWCEADAE